MPSVVAIEIVDLVQDVQLHRDWETCLSDLGEATEEQKQAVLTPIAALRDEFITALNEVEDAADREMICAVFYVLLKSHWMLLNIRSGYLIREGRLDLSVMCQSGLLTALLDRVEQSLSREQILTLTRFLSQPLGDDKDGDRFPIPEPEWSGPLGEKVRVLLDNETDAGHPTTIVDREAELVRIVLDHQQQLERAREEQAILGQEFGTISARQICELFANMRRSVASLLDQLNLQKEEKQRLLATVSTGDSTELKEEFVAIHARLAQLEDEVAAYRARDERLIAATGSSDINEIIARFNAPVSANDVMDELRDVLGSLEHAFDMIE